MTAITRQRCANHFSREAVSNCMVCARHFCRECVTEHHDQMLCSSCLERTAAQLTGKEQTAGWIGLLSLAAGALFLVWTLFYWAGDLLARSQ